MNVSGYIHTPLHYRSYSYNQKHLIASEYERLIDKLGREMDKLRRAIDKVHRTLLLSKVVVELFGVRQAVFVSHKSNDKSNAEQVATKIKACGLKPYLDIWDLKVYGDGPELVDYIDTVIGHCNSLVAVVSHNTVHSWWVPLEIGIAITKDLYLGTFLDLDNPPLNLPSYLWKWPVLKNMEDLENWCKEREKGTPPQVFYESLKQKHPNMFKQ